MSSDRVVVVGDLVNDIVATPRTELRPDTDTTSSIRPRPGGSAANTAAWLGSLGVPTDFVGAAGSQDADAHRRILAEHGVTAHLQIEYGVPTGTIVIIVQGESRTMLTERGANALLDTSRVTDELLAAARMLHLSAYAFLDGFGLPGARDLIARAKAAGVPVAVNPGSAGYIQDFGPELFLDAVEGADILFPNVAEGRLLTGEDEPERILDALSARFPVVVLTQGSAGASGRVRGGRTVFVPAPSVRLVDPTGAGDAFAAGFLQRWLVDASLDSALETGAHVAARAVLAIGGRPPV